MSAYPRRMSAELMNKLHQWAAKRQAHFSDLQQSGRWRRYYTENEFAALRQDADRSANEWKRLAQPD
jgi:hypothetical protein